MRFVVNKVNVPSQVAVAVFKKLVHIFLGNTGIIEANSNFLLIQSPLEALVVIGVDKLCQVKLLSNDVDYG